MKKIYTIAIIGLLACTTMLVTGCKKEGGKGMLRARIAQDSYAKVYMNGNKACWHEGDWVNVNGQVSQAENINGSTADFIYIGLAGQYYAVYPAAIVTRNDEDGIIAIDLPDVQEYSEDSQGRQIVQVPLGGYKEGEDSREMTLYPLSSLVKIVLSSEVDFALERIELTAADHALSGAGTATITEDGSGNAITMGSTVIENVSGEASTTESSDTSHSVALDFAASGNQQIRQGERNTYVYYIAVPSYAGADDITITLWGSHRGIGVSKIVEKENVTLSRNSIASVFVSVKGEWDWIEEIDPNELRGVFSIGNGRTVRFSRGNLQYDRVNETWQFAQNQYDFIGSSNIASDNFHLGSVIDLFGWGTWVGVVHPTRISLDLSDYPPHSNWHSSYNGIEGEWYTMSANDWDYLMYGRSGGYKFGLGCIGDGDDEIGGLILLPDEWELPAGCSFVGSDVISSEGDGELNHYSYSQWEAMEAAGAVFLPAAGERYIHIGDPYDGVPAGFLDYIGYYEQTGSWNGIYWTQSESPDGDDDIATGLFFGWDGYDYGTVMVDATVAVRSNGYSVRLVKISSSNSTGSKNGNIGKKRIK